MSDVDKILVAAEVMSSRVRDPRNYPISQADGEMNKLLKSMIKSVEDDAFDRLKDRLSGILKTGAIQDLEAFFEGCENQVELNVAHMLSNDVFNVCRPGGVKIAGLRRDDRGNHAQISTENSQTHFIIDISMPVTVQLDPCNDDNEGAAEPWEFNLELITGFADQMLKRMQLPACAKLTGSWEVKAPQALNSAQQFMADGQWFSTVPIAQTVALGTSCLQSASSQVLATLEPKLYFCCATIAFDASEYSGRHTSYEGLFPSDLSDDLQAKSMSILCKMIDPRLLVVMGAPMVAGHAFEVARGMMRQARLLTFSMRSCYEGAKLTYAFGRDDAQASWLYVRADDDAIVLQLSRLEPWEAVCYGFQQMFMDANPVEVDWDPAFLQVR